MSVVVGHWMNEWVVGLKKINSQNLTDQRLKFLICYWNSESFTCLRYSNGC